MKSVIVCTLVGAIGISSATKLENAQHVPQISNTVEANQPKSFFKSTPIECQIKEDELEKSLTNCLKSEKRWLHI